MKVIPLVDVVFVVFVGDLKTLESYSTFNLWSYDPFDERVHLLS